MERSDQRGKVNLIGCSVQEEGGGVVVHIFVCTFF